MSSSRTPGPAPTPVSGRDRLLTPGTYDKVVLSRQDSKQNKDAEDFVSVRQVLFSKPFLSNLISNTIVTFAFNILFSWGTLSTWNAHAISPIYLFRPIQPAGDKGAATSMSIDIIISTFLVAFMNCLSTWERTDDADLGKLGRLRPELVSKGLWRFAPKGSNWIRATLSALLFCLIFAGISITVLVFLWVSGVGGEWMEVDGWSYIIPKAALCSIECVIVFTISYVVALSRCARSQRNATLQRMRDGAILCTKIINWLQMLGAVIIAGFTGYTYFFAFGGIQLGPLIGMWTCSAFMFVLSLRGLFRANSSLNRASGGDLVYIFLMILTFIGVLVCSGFCIVYSEQGIFIIKDNWEKIKVGLLLPFTSEYDLQETVTINLQSTAGFGFGFSIIVLFGILHFTKRLGPGQNLILMVQALNFTLMCSGCMLCWLVHDVSVITSYGASNGALNMIIVMTLGLIYVTVSIFIGSFVASGSRAPFNLLLYSTFLLVLVIPTIIYSIRLFDNATNVEMYIYNRWNEIVQLLPGDQPLWTKCSASEVTRCKEGLIVTARANFQAVGWLAVVMACVGFLNGMLALSLRKWHLRYDMRQKLGYIESNGRNRKYSHQNIDDVENSTSALRTPRRSNSKGASNSTEKLKAGNYGYGTGGYGTAAESSSKSSEIYNSSVGSSTSNEQDTYHIFDDSQSDVVGAPSPGIRSNSNHRSDSDNTFDIVDGSTAENRNGSDKRTRGNQNKVRWSFVSQSGLGLSLSTCLGHAPSSTLRVLRRWAAKHPFVSLVVGTAIVTGITIGIAFSAYVIGLRSTCAVVASKSPYGAVSNNQTLLRSLNMPVPYGCLCENEFDPVPTPVWYPTSTINGTEICPASLYSSFGITCLKLPKLNLIKLNHNFKYGSVLIQSKNSTINSNITVSLNILGNHPVDVMNTWLTNTSEWFIYNETSGAIDVHVDPPEHSTTTVLGYDVSCVSAELIFTLPMPLLDIDVYSQGNPPTQQKPFIYCVNSQSNPSPSTSPTGCIDLFVQADSVSISIESESELQVGSLGKNGSQSELFTALLDEIPFGDITVLSKFGNLITESIFAVGNVKLETSLGNAIMKNSFAKDVKVHADAGDVEGVDIAAFKNIQAILSALTPHSTTKLLHSDFGMVTMGTGAGDCISTGIFA